MGKNVQISQALLTDVYRLVLTLTEDMQLVDVQDVAMSIKAQIDAKIDAMERRKLFTEYKTLPQGELKESKRIEYLEKAGYHKDWIGDGHIFKDE